MSYPGYEPVKILDVYVNVGGQQIYYNKMRNEYAIERKYKNGISGLGPLSQYGEGKLAGMLELEKAELDAADRHDDDGKEAGR